jgi:hemolysin III
MVYERRLTQSHLSFPQYTVAERRADALIHLLGLIGAPLAVVWLFGQTGPSVTPSRIASAVVYAFGLVGMLYASAFYNLMRAGRIKATLRRLDHAMIFVMIAGSYTPLSLTALRPGLGIPLCAGVWTLALLGATLKIRHPYRYERTGLFLCLAMGWSLLPLLPRLFAALPAGILELIIGGGVLYTVGAFIHTRVALPFHNAAWHALVFVAAALHLIAMGWLISLPLP